MKPERPANAPNSVSAVARRAVMVVLAQATADELTSGLENAGLDSTELMVVRAPQTGLVMVRGRQGGSGKPFNLGEATVTRAVVQTPRGTIGASYLLGRVPEKAHLAAIIDAFWQQSEHRDAIERNILAPVRARLEQERQKNRAETAATTVDFFTLVRGDD